VSPLNNGAAHRVAVDEQGAHYYWVGALSARG